VGHRLGVPVSTVSAGVRVAVGVGIGVGIPLVVGAAVGRGVGVGVNVGAGVGLVVTARGVAAVGAASSPSSLHAASIKITTTAPNRSVFISRTPPRRHWVILVQDSNITVRRKNLAEPALPFDQSEKIDLKTMIKLVVNPCRLDIL
jgi:hypothetical protein